MLWRGRPTASPFEKPRPRNRTLVRMLIRTLDSWRVEVATRLARYRTRRKPRTPRYPSLLLPFDSTESWSRLAPPSGATAVRTRPARDGRDFNFRIEEDYAAAGARSLVEPGETWEGGPDRYPEQVPEQSAKVIEFPRSAAIPVSHPNDLADPVFDLERPRIVEAPDILPPPPALGGMLLEPAQPEQADSRAGTDFPRPSASPSASIARRALGGPCGWRCPDNIDGGLCRNFSALERRP